MNYRKLGGFVLLGLLVICGILVLLRDYVIEKADPQAELTDLSAAFTASEEIDAAKQRLADGVKPAEVMTRLQDDSRRIAIVIDGLPERPLTERILDVLQKHDAPATFFVEGQNAAEQPETIERIYNTGYEIGNYPFVCSVSFAVHRGWSQRSLRMRRSSFVRRARCSPILSCRR